MKLKKLIKRFKFQRKKKRVRTSCNEDLDLTFLSQMDHFHLIKSQIRGIYNYIFIIMKVFFVEYQVIVRSMISSTYPESNATGRERLIRSST